MRNAYFRIGGDPDAFDRLWGGSDALMEWTPSLHQWANIGFFDRPFSSASQRRRYKECDPCSSQGEVSIKDWPW